MNQEWVTVTQIEADGVWVESLQRSACDSCNARSGCGQRTLSQLGRTIKLWVPTDMSLALGQQVQLQLPVGGLALSALMLYGIPLLVLMLAAALAQPLGELWAIGLGSVGLLIGLSISRVLTQKCRHWWQPSIIPSCIPLIVEK